MFGPYRLDELIGRGGMGEVYRAYDTARERMVAIKLLRPEMAADPSFQERFRRESRVAARLQEPHVSPVHDFGEIDGVLFIDMRLVEGASLKEVLRTHGPLQPRRAVAIIRQVAEGDKPVVFMLWGSHAQSKRALIPQDRGHLVLTSNHPSPLSALRPPVPFIGNGHFSQAQAFRKQLGL